MKKTAIIIGILFLAISSITAQSPDSFNYQAVINDATGQPIAGQTIGMKISIIRGSATGTLVYSETHQPTTNQFGLVSLNIGEGSIPFGIFSKINWSGDVYFVKVEVDIKGGTNYVEIGTSQLLSVPYALYAKNAGSADEVDPQVGTISKTYVPVWNGSSLVTSSIYDNGNVGIGIASPTVKLQVKSLNTIDNVALFEVQDDLGQPVFQVFRDGVKITVPPTGKAKADHHGSLTISGRGTKADVNLFNITKDNYFIGHNVAPGILSTGLRNSVFGYMAGNGLTSGDDNVFIGNMAGYSATTPVRNICIGSEAGYSNERGQYNLYIGDEAGKMNTGLDFLGFNNTVLGGQAASTNNFGNSNVVIGYVAGRDIKSSTNVMIGQGAGYNNVGLEGGNVFIGYYAGEDYFSETTGNHKLVISSDRTKEPLIYGEFDNQLVRITGDLVVTGSLDVTGSIINGVKNLSSETENLIVAQQKEIDALKAKNKDLEIRLKKIEDFINQ